MSIKKVVTGSLISASLLLSAAPAFATTGNHALPSEKPSGTVEAKITGQKIQVRKEVEQVSAAMAAFKVKDKSTIVYEEGGYYGVLTATSSYTSSNGTWTKYYTVYTGYAYKDIGI
ncbi:hypothetical protein HF695_10785 [Bacillus safensis]|uniref:hypothetical protein n=1 Tax=Bacillus TaxID=1386 RepID=UPI001BA555B9|nr:hypothetical protein [Bacillus safensis]MBR0602806.1 hypothetical protein [Bacillus safensis]MDH3107496.1 hypothetical protein [Bacillus altitudinis]